MYFLNRRRLVPLFYSSYETQYIKHMITKYDMFYLRLQDNILAMLYRRLYGALFQGNSAK